jgi:hypothetical protein
VELKMADVFLKGLERLEQIFTHLYAEEPTPDEEINAQEEFRIIFEELISNLDENSMDLKPILQETLNLVNEWDTLDKWFAEIPELIENFEKILGKPPKKQIVQEKQDLPDPIEEIKDEEIDTLGIDEIFPEMFEEKEENQKEIPMEKKETFESLVKSNQEILQNLVSQSRKQAEKSSRRSIDPMKARSKLQPPKVIIPKVTKPIKKIYPGEPIKDISEIPNTSSKKIILLKPKASIKKKPIQVQTPISDQDQSISQPIVQNLSIKSSIPKFEIKTEIPKLKVKTQIKTNDEPKILQAPKFQPSSSTKPKIKIKVSTETITNKQTNSNNEIPFVEIPEGTNTGISVKTQPLRSKKKPTMPIIKPSQVVVKDSKEDLFNILLGKSEQKNKKFTAIKEKPRKNGQKASIQQKFNFTENDNSKPLTKDELYQELIALEGKKYAIEKTRKRIKTKHDKGDITNAQFITSTDSIRRDLEHISGKINDAREKIQAL